mgnify:CR=1 FL=1
MACDGLGGCDYHVPAMNTTSTLTETTTGIQVALDHLCLRFSGRERDGRRALLAQLLLCRLVRAGRKPQRVRLLRDHSGAQFIFCLQWNTAERTSDTAARRGGIR